MSNSNIYRSSTTTRPPTLTRKQLTRGNNREDRLVTYTGRDGNVPTSCRVFSMTLGIRMSICHSPFQSFFSRYSTPPQSFSSFFLAYLSLSVKPLLIFFSFFSFSFYLFSPSFFSSYYSLPFPSCLYT